MTYPRLGENERIKKGYKYSYRYLVSVPYTTMETFESSVNLVMIRLNNKFPLKQLNIAYATVEKGVPSRVDFVFVFEKDPGLTHGEFSEQIKNIAKEVYWDLDLEEIILLEKKPFPWIWLGLLLLLGVLGLKEREGD